MRDEVECRYHGRDFTTAEMALMRSLIAASPQQTRAGLAREFCHAINWVGPDDRIRAMMARLTMLAMHRDGIITLPPPRQAPRRLRKPEPCRETDPPQAPVPETLEAVRPIRLVCITGADRKASRVWNGFVARWHYLGYTPLIGAQMRYAAEDREGRTLALLGFSAAAWKTAPRDAFIGWSPQVREKNLQYVIDNSRYLILPWVRIPNLASHILSEARRQLPQDWYDRYKVTPILDKEIGERDSRTTRDVIQGRIVASSITRVIPLMSFCNTAIFCCLDDFAQTFEDWEHHNLIPTGRKRRRSGKLCLGEMLFIMVLFHLSPFKDFKHFWHYGVEQKYRDYFGDIPSYGRFVSLMPRLFIPFCVLMHSLTGDQTGIYVADSTKIAVCHNLRISRNRVFADLAKRGKTTTGWFYGFKLHVIINHKGEIMAIKITPGNTDDRSVLDDMTRELEGKVLADKGYISKELFAKLWRRGLHLITGIRRNMKNYLMPLLDKLLLRKRFIIETLFDRLKSQMGLEHTRHRSPINAFVHILSCLAAYTLGKTKVRMSAVR